MIEAKVQKLYSRPNKYTGLRATVAVTYHSLRATGFHVAQRSSKLKVIWPDYLKITDEDLRRDFDAVILTSYLAMCRHRGVSAFYLGELNNERAETT